MHLFFHCQGLNVLQSWYLRSLGVSQPTAGLAGAAATCQHRGWLGGSSMACDRCCRWVSAALSPCCPVACREWRQWRVGVCVFAEGGGGSRQDMKTSQLVAVSSKVLTLKCLPTTQQVD